MCNPYRLRQACVIFGTVTIFGVTSWYLTPEENWLPRAKILQALQAADEPEVQGSGLTREDMRDERQ